MRCALFASILIAVGAAASAQAHLGITGAEFRLGFVQRDDNAGALLGPIKSEQGLQPTLGFAAVNVAITRHHGLQGDILLEGTPDGAIGRIAGHLFMTPSKGQKYGLFAVVGDVDNESVTYGHLGAEGILPIGPDGSLELRGGIGLASAEGLDYIFAGARFSHEPSQASLVYLDVTISEFDEPGFRTIAQDITLGADTRLTKRIGLYASRTLSRLPGTGAADEVILRAGITLTFGNVGATAPESQMFHTVDPVATLVRRGFF